MNKPITKTLIASALILVLAVSFVACGGRGNKPPVSTDPSTTDAVNIIPDITDDNTDTDTDTVPETDKKDGTPNKDAGNATAAKKEADKKTENTTTTKKKVNNTTTTKKKVDNKPGNTTTTKKNNTEPGTQTKKVRIMDWCPFPGITNVDDGSGEYSKAGYEFPKKYTHDYNGILAKMEGLGYCTKAERDARRQPQTPGTGTIIDPTDPQYTGGIKF